MGSRFLKRLKRPLSVSTYAVLFIGLSMMAYSVLGWFSIEQLDRFQLETEQTGQEGATQEIAEGISRIAEKMRQISTDFSVWDEMHRQSASPEFYDHWRHTLLPNSHLLPEYIQAVETYDAEGRRLGRHGETRLPAAITPADLGLYLVSQESDITLIAFIPSKNPTQESGTAHTVGLQADFKHMLMQLSRFRFLDEASLSITLPAQQRVLLDEAQPLIHYRLKPYPEQKALRQILTSSMFRMGLAIIVLSALFYVSGLFLFGLPLQRLSRHIDILKRTSRARQLKGFPLALPVVELEKVRQSLNEYQLQLTEAQDHLESMNKELWNQARHDALTNALNRRAFDEDWRNVQALMKDQRLPICFLLFDCDHFKAINDSYGHQIGDEVVKSIAEGLRQGLRKGDRLYRLGGDEFAALLINCDQTQGNSAAERCIQQLNHYDYSRFEIMEPVRVSAGLACASGSDGLELNALKWQADVAMYHAKRPGRGQIAVYSKEMATISESLFSNWITSAVYQAITSGQGLEMHYQPIVALNSESDGYYEALVRIRDNDTLIPPADIFPIVESKRLEVELDLAVTKRVLQDLWAGKLPRGTGVSINISGPTIIRPDIVETLTGFIPFMKDYKCVLEITETALITHLKQASDNLKQLREIGFVIALDDFGSGYSSMQYLATMPVDIVKFDISMTRCLERDQRHRLIVESLAQMIKDSGYQMVAEGIETDTISRLVREIGFQYAQGYYYGRPSPQVVQLRQAAN